MQPLYDYKPQTEENTRKNTYNSATLKNLVESGQFQDAATYLSSFRFNNPVEEQNRRDYLNRLNEMQAKDNAFYGGMDTKTYERSKFASYWNTETGYKVLQGNSIYDKYNSLYRRLGDGQDAEGNKMTASSFDIKFSNKRTGIFGIDFLLRDDKYSFKTFCDTYGYTEDSLKNSGVTIDHISGQTIIKTDKSNYKAKQLLYDYSDFTKHMISGRSPKRGNPDITFYDTNNKAITVDKDGLDNSAFQNASNLRKMRRIVIRANGTKDKYSRERSLDTREYSSVVMGPVSDKLKELDDMLNAGQIESTEYKRLRDIELGRVKSVLRGIGEGDYEFYSDIDNDDEDKRLKPIANASEILTQIKSVPMTEITLNTMMSNGKIGTLVTILGKHKENSDTVTRKPINIFIPELFNKEAQKMIMHNTKYRASQYVDNMQTYNYSYTDSKDNVITPVGNGMFSYKDNLIDKETAVRLINKDYILKDGDYLSDKYTNAEGKIFDVESYDMQCKTYAVKAAAELVPGFNISLGNTREEIVNNLNKIFSMQSAYGEISDEYNGKMSASDIAAYNLIFEIYNRLYNKVNKQLS